MLCNIPLHNMLFIVLLYVVTFVIIIIDLYYHRTIDEGFMSGPCPNCGKRSKSQCFTCGTCGWCVTPNGYGECVPGNKYGPFFRQDCVNWQYDPPLPTRVPFYRRIPFFRRTPIFRRVPFTSYKTI